jgi:hypothetical protein
VRTIPNILSVAAGGRLRPLAQDGACRQILGLPPLRALALLTALPLGGCSLLLREAPCPPGDADSGPDSAPDSGAAPAAFAAVAAGALHSCGADAAGAVSCWGLDEEGQASPPDGLTAAALALGHATSCAADADGALRCWGRGADGEDSPPATLADLTLGAGAVDLGGAHGCLADAAGAVACWGDDGDGQAAPPGDLGPARAVIAGWRQSCALAAADGALRCWGAPLAEAAPAGPFAAVDLGRDFGVGLGADGALSCWGDAAVCDLLDELNPGPWAEIAAGRDFACAADADGQVACAGARALAPPDGPVTGLRAAPSGLHACGLGPDAAAVCFGEGDAGQLDPEATP